MPLGNAEAAEFFRRARVVDAHALHDRYDHAPCLVEGTLKHQSESCDRKIRAGATGAVHCGERKWLFACDTGDELFTPRAPR